MKCLLMAVTVGLGFSSTTWAGSITIVGGRVGVKEFGPAAVSGPGVVGAYVQVEGTGQKDPTQGAADGVKKLNDQTTIGTTMEAPIDEELTKRVGQALKGAVGLALDKKTDLEAGRLIFYKIDESDDKVKAAKDAGGEQNFFVRAAIGNLPTASASHTVKVDKNGKVEADGTVNVNTRGRGQFAAGILNDPILFQATSSTLDPTIDLILTRDLFLQATLPGDLAEAAFQIAQDGELVFDFALRVTAGTTSAAQAIVPLAWDERLFGDEDHFRDYLEQTILPFLNWNPGSRSLTSLSNITLYSMISPSDGTPIEVTYNYIGLASTPVPEPSTLMLGGLGIMGLIPLVGRDRRRRNQVRTDLAAVKSATPETHRRCDLRHEIVNQTTLKSSDKTIRYPICAGTA